MDTHLLSGLKWRLVGPYRGGRTHAVVGHPTERMTFFFGSVGGGVWKTTNAGKTWDNISDPYFKRGSVGAMAISRVDSNLMLVGMGEPDFVQFHSGGDGVYKSEDGGATWRHVGLEQTQTIGRVLFHPRNPDILYVAALGHRFGPNPERGVYRSTDGGSTWEQVLFRSETAGCVDLTIDETNPRILYVAFWDAMVTPWGRTSGGPDSSMYKSTDGGTTWTDISRNPGLPGLMGKIGIAASPLKTGRVWAIIEAEQGGMYRSDDGGAHWTWLNDDPNFIVRPHYHHHVVASPNDANTVYLPHRKLWKSTDGGRTYGLLNTSYVDQHDLWIDPNDSQRMILGNDGGASVSFDGGVSWSTLVNQPTAEIYRLATDTRFPYYIYGSQQDNSTLALPSRSDKGPISEMEWYDVGGGESGFIAVRPDNPNIVYSSDLPGLGVTKYDHATHQIREIGPWGEPGSWDIPALRYRFNWCVPVELSPHDPNILYVAGQYVFRSTNEGQSWDEISPDLTRNDVSKQGPVGLPISREDSSAHQYGNIASVNESPVERGVIWVGTDDGLVQVTRDDGATWTNVTPPDMPEWALTRVEPSRHTVGTAYVAATTYQLDDYRPYIFLTTNYGQTWTRIVEGIINDHFVRVVREDAVTTGLLYAGTEVGVYASLDAGASWFSLSTNLPTSPVFDIAVKDNDVVIATHGRSMWILDDVTPLREMAAGVPTAALNLFPPAPVTRVTRMVYRLESLITLYEPYAADNPPSGVVVYYYVNSAPNEMSITLLDANGTVLQAFSSTLPAPPQPTPIGALRYELRGGARLTGAVTGEPEMNTKWGRLTTPTYEPTIVPMKPGLNRFALPIQYPGATVLPRLLGGGITDPAAVPGVYTVELRFDGKVLRQPVEIRKDPRVPTAQEEYQAQFDLLIEIRDLITRIYEHVESLWRMRDQIRDRIMLAANLVDGQAMREAGEAIIATLTEIENLLIQPGLNRQAGELAGIHYTDKLVQKLEAISYQVARSDNVPTKQAYDLFNLLVPQIDAALERYADVFVNDVVAFNALCTACGVPQVMRG